MLINILFKNVMCIYSYSTCTQKKKNSIKPKSKAMVTLGFRKMGVATEEEHIEGSKGMGKVLFLNLVERYPGICFISL